jgi:SAM-dependent methyltransferase
MNCRHCNNKLLIKFIDLGYAPSTNDYLDKNDLNKPEILFPLRIFTCTNCWLVQTEDYKSSEDIFQKDYAYFSSTSKYWLQHAKNYSEMIIERLKLDSNSNVIEIASNDGYMLKNFVNKNIPCFGIEPTVDTANAATKIGVKTMVKFFDSFVGKSIKQTNKQADLIIANNVFAHVPDINDFTLGLKNALKNNGTITIEIAYLKSLIENNQFDTTYHEHFSYLSLTSAINIIKKQNLRVYDVELLESHGGSLRLYICHDSFEIESNIKVNEILNKEKLFGITKRKIYETFQQKADKAKNDFISLLIDLKGKNKSIVGYGAASKGTTLLNYAGIKPDLLPVICDAAESKQEKFIPGCHIPIKHPNIIKKIKPDYIIILPWNISKEISSQLSFVKDWGCKFVTAIPELKVW